MLPNLAFFLFGREFFINRELINCDYLFLWVGSCYLRRRTTVLLYLGLLVLDLILSTESIYHFTTVETLVLADEYRKFYPAALYSMAGGLVLLAMVALAVTRRRGVVRPLLSKRGRILIGTIAAALSAAGAMRSYDPFDRNFETYGGSEVAASGVIETGLASYRVAMPFDQNQAALPATAAATANVARDISPADKAAAPGSILVVLVESQGLLKSASDMRRVLAPLTAASIRARYTVNTGAVRFFGATMFGELRTLCRIYVPQAIPQNLPGLDRCLPNVLSRLGYETVSYHGFNRWFYERYLWYPAVGFQRSYFADELKQHAPPMCGTAVRGVCDLWIADQVERELSASGKRGKFVYWLTLNSHYPIDSALASQSGFDCAATDTLREEIGPCELARIHFQLYTRIAQIALNDQLPPTRFVVVGDHMPPFPALSERALYDEERVPFVELIPRAELFRVGAP